MSSRSRKRVAQGPNYPVEVAAAPKDGTPIEVRLLGPWETTHVHYNGHRPVPCQGDGRCEPRLHRSNISWKGFIPAELWLPTTCVWVPCVAEVTEFAAESMRDRELRGEIWELKRVPPNTVGAKVFAKLLASVPWSEIPAAFDVRPVVQKTYHNVLMLWDLPFLFEPTLMLPISQGAPPPGRRGAPLPKEQAQAEEKAKEVAAAEIWKTARANGKV